MSDSGRPHRWQPTRLPCPWNSPGKNTGVGCHFLLQCMKVKSESEVAQSCPTLETPWTAAYQASIHGIFQARVLECGAIAFSVLCPNSYKSYHSLFQYPHANNCKQVANKLNLQYQLLLAKGNTWSFSQLLTKFSWSAVGRFGKCGMWWLWQTFTS